MHKDIILSVLPAGAIEFRIQKRIVRLFSFLDQFFVENAFLWFASGDVFLFKMILNGIIEPYRM